jgi:anti-anti-sigma regulatory factor
LLNALRRSHRSPGIRVERRAGRTQITRVLDRLTSQNVEPLHQALLRCIRRAPPTLVVDLADALYVDTTVLAVLIDGQALITAQRTDTRFVVHGSSTHRRLERVWRLESVLRLLCA